MRMPYTQIHSITVARAAFVSVHCVKFSMSIPLLPSAYE